MPYIFLECPFHGGPCPLAVTTYDHPACRWASAVGFSLCWVHPALKTSKENERGVLKIRADSLACPTANPIASFHHVLPAQWLPSFYAHCSEYSINFSMLCCACKEKVGKLLHRVFWVGDNLMISQCTCMMFDTNICSERSREETYTHTHLSLLAAWCIWCIYRYFK